MRKLLRGRGDDGVALVAAMAVVMLVGILMVIVVTIAIHESGSTGRERQRAVAVSTAEGQVDATMAQIQSAGLGSLPCGSSSTTASLAADSFHGTLDVVYYSGADASTQLSCNDVAAGTVTATSVYIKASDTSAPIAGQQKAKRTVETMLKLTPVYDNALNKAIFGDAGVVLSNKTVLRGSDGTPNADVYTKGSFACQNNEEFDGSIYVQGDVTMSNTCTVTGDVWAGGNITVTNPNTTIQGRALAFGNIDLGPGKLGQQARAKGSVQGDVCSTTGKCFSGDPTIKKPPSQPFPTIDWTSQAQFQGYSTVVTFPDDAASCGMVTTGPNNGKADKVAQWIVDHAASLHSSSTILDYCSNQPVLFQGVDMTLYSNLAIFAADGFSFSNKTKIAAAPGTATAADPLDLYFIQPASSTCNGDGISLDNQVTIDATVDTLMYSPCNIRKANLSQITGQVYSGGTVQVDNQLDMTYEPLPVWGIIGAGTNIKSYTGSVLYKRENG
jgi:Tfp pilus assembly protein PilX